MVVDLRERTLKALRVITTIGWVAIGLTIGAVLFIDGIWGFFLTLAKIGIAVVGFYYLVLIPITWIWEAQDQA